MLASRLAYGLCEVIPLWVERRRGFRTRSGGRHRSGRRTKVRFVSWSVRSVLDYVKIAAVVAIAAVYSYALFLQPILAEDPPLWPVFGSSLSRLTRMSVNQLPVSASEGHCDVPIMGSVLPATTALFYGVVGEPDLPWSAEPPTQLTELRRQTGANRLLAAFRITLPNPMWDETANVARGASHLAGTIVNPGQSLSLVAAIGPITGARGYGDGPGYAAGRIVPTAGGGVCKIGTALYNALVYSDLEVLERKPHSMLVPYVPPGRDAAIATGSKDVRFRNNKDTPILLWAGMQHTTLFVALYGQYEPPVVEWHHEELSRKKVAPERRPNPDLPSGVEQLVIEGYDGVTVRTWLTIRHPGQQPERRDLGVDTYRPLPGIIEYGP